MFANTPGTARTAFDRVQKLVAAANGSIKVLLLTGRAREREQEWTRARILDPVDGMPASRDAAKGRRRHLVVIATQVLEVGADLDAEYLVTEAGDRRALTQRLGRLNRLGRHAHARGVLRPSDGGRVAGLRLGTGERAAEAEGCLGRRLCRIHRENLPPRQIAEVLGAPEDDPGRAPQVCPGCCGNG